MPYGGKSPNVSGSFWFYPRYSRRGTSTVDMSIEQTLLQEKLKQARWRQKHARRRVNQTLREYHHWLLSFCEADADNFLQKTRGVLESSQLVTQSTKG